MSYDRNVETQEAVTSEIKGLRSRCVDAYNIIENAPSDTHFMTPDNIPEKTLCYVEGLRTDIENSNASIVTDDNLLTSQFLSDIKLRTSEVEEMIAYTRGSILDVDTEINRLNTLIKTSQEAKSIPRVQRQDVRPEHLQKAKEKFHQMKNELHSLIQSLFPSNAEMITEIMAELMMNKLSESSSEYITITSENYQLIELLKDINIVTANPYNNMEVKLAY